MEKRAVAVAMALIIPLALYGIPYAYAATTSSTYVVYSLQSIVHGDNFPVLKCNSGDYATGSGYGFSGGTDGTVYVAAILPTDAAENIIHSGTPAGIEFIIHNSNAFTTTAEIFVFCQTPITVAGIAVPEFGSLYVAIALGAVVYFLLARHFARRPTVSAQVGA